MKYVLLACAAIAATEVSAETLARETGLAHWAKVYDVLSNPRCANCHVGDDNRPMWSGPNYGVSRKHGMNINAGTSRSGEEHIACSTCHGATNGTLPHAPPGAAAEWRLAPVEFEWFGKSSREVCEQMRDPARNGGRSANDLAEHVNHDAFVGWGWEPGLGRTPAPLSQAEHEADIRAWGAAGMPCPS